MISTCKHISRPIIEINKEKQSAQKKNEAKENDTGINTAISNNGLFIVVRGRRAAVHLDVKSTSHGLRCKNK